MMLLERDIADILGNICDGIDVSPEQREAALAALTGMVLTSDKGKRVYYVDLDTMLLDNVDTAEGIWSLSAVEEDPNGSTWIDLSDDNATFQAYFFALPLICNTVGFERLQAKWMTDANTERQLAWQQLLERVVAPLRSVFDCLAF